MKFPLRMSVSGLIKHHAHFGLIALALFATAGIWILDDYGVSLDTGAQRSITMRNLDYVLDRRDTAYPRDDFNRFYGITFELPLLLLERGLGLDDTRDIHLMRHLVTHLFFLVGGFFCYLLAYRLFGSRLLAVLAVLIFILHPRLYAHSFFNSKDIPFLSMFMVCLYLTHRAFGNGGIWRFLILGVAVGVLINLRIMGVALFVMIVVIQVIDAFGEVRRALSLTGVFMLSCLVTLYTVSPYLWIDPVGGMIEWFAEFSQHPNNVLQMFRGVLTLSSDVHPPEYVPVWMSVTTPPAVVVLGIAGTCLVLLRGLFRPHDVLANTHLRFGFMLVGCLSCPVAAVIILNSNVYDGWRHMYFLYAPLCLLAVFGLHQVISMLNSARLRSGLYGACGIGLAAAVASMFSIHPHEYIYFNFLVDRTTPEHLRTRYNMDYWHVSLRQAYEHLLEKDPSATIRARTSLPVEEILNWEILAESDRERLILQGEHYDFYITGYKDWLRSESDRLDLTAPLVYSGMIYNSKVLEVAAMDMSLVDDAVAARYREKHHAAVSSKPAASSEWDVYVDDATLTYIKEPCTADDHEPPPFFLSVTMDDIDDLPDYRRRNGHVTRNFDFEFGRFGIRFDEICMATVPLPEDGISGVRTGQFTSDNELWSVAVNLRARGESIYRAEHESVVRDDPVIRSEFDIYLRDGRMIYVKEPCVVSDTGAKFFLHVVPSDVDDLPPSRRESGFDNLDFVFETRGMMFDGMCIASIGLPDYHIKRVNTGQLIASDGIVLWAAGYNVSAATELPGIVEELRERGTGPVIRSHFDVYMDEYRLVHFKSPCTTEDTVAPFFVHLYPDDLDDLPPDRRSLGFESFSFNMLDQGVMSADGCFTRFDLPDYEVAGFLTGQFVHGEGKLWEDGHSFSAAELPGIVEELRGSGNEPVVRSYFDVYMDNYILIYVRQQCDVSDVEAEFFLHVVPSSIDDLPPPRKESGFYNLDFVFNTHGLMFDGMCIASIGLPDYEIERIRTGQWDSEHQRNLWKEEFDVVE